MLKLTKLFLLILSMITFSLCLTSCGGDDDKVEGCTNPIATNYNADATVDDGSCELPCPNTPTTFSFTNASYGGQVVRNRLLEDLKALIDGGTATEAGLLEIYENPNDLFYSEISTGKNLSGKIINAEIDAELKAYFAEIDALGGTKVNADGLDLAQMVNKISTAAIAYHHGVNTYLGGIEMTDNSSLVEGKDYTQMEHWWDEAYGYYGAARDYLSYSDQQLANNNHIDSDGDGVVDYDSEYNFGYARNGGKRDLTAAGFSAASQTDFTKTIFEAFTAGRCAIANGDFAGRDAAKATILDNWEKVIAATVVHYISDTKADYQALTGDNDDLGDLRKHWAEMYAFTRALGFSQVNSLVTHQDHVLGLMRNTTADAFPPILAAGSVELNEYMSRLDEAAGLFKEAYNFTDEQIAGW